MPHAPHIGSRALFPDLEATLYLNHAAISPPSVPVRDAITRMVDRYAQRGAAAFFEADAHRSRLKEQLGALLGCSPRDLALTASTGRGIIDISVCLRWAPGDRILCFDGEFPANVVPWLRTAEACDLTVIRLEQNGVPDDDLLERVERSLRDGKIRLVACSLVQYATGRLMPVAELARLAHRYGASILVDGVQALGVVPVDVRAMDVDIFVGGAHKWLMGVEGLGYAYIHPRLLPQLHPRTAGWLSLEEPLAFLLEGPERLDYDAPVRNGADFLEAHSGSTLGVAALEASTALLLQLGIAAIHDHVRRWLDRAEEGLRERGFTIFRDRTRSSGILAVLPPDGDALRWSALLGRSGIAVSAPDGKLRLAPHWPNALEEVDRLLEAVDGLLG